MMMYSFGTNALPHRVVVFTNRSGCWISHELAALAKELRGGGNQAIHIHIDGRRIVMIDVIRR
jgi:hypothetical protein